MKLHQLVETNTQKVPDEILEWIHEVCPLKYNSTLKDSDWVYRDRKLNYEPVTKSPTKNIVRMICTEIKYPLGSIGGSIYFGHPSMTTKLESLKNIPQKVERSMSFSGQRLMKIDSVTEAVIINFSSNEITSVANIHKFIDCNILRIGGNPISGSITDILRIKGLEDIDNSDTKDDGSDFCQAIEIISKYIGYGNSGIVRAQRELIENDLEDFA